MVVACLFLVVSTRAQTTEAKNDGEYLKRIHTGDLIDIHVPGYLEYDWRGRINPEGFLDGFDKISKQIYALCRTESEVAADVTRELAATVRSPKTEVRVVDISRRSPAIFDGAVAVPTRFQIRREARLIELLTAAGGMTDRSSGKISIFRPARASCFEPSSAANVGPTEISISSLLSGDPAANVVIVSGDLVLVSEAQPVFIVGAVATQGRMDFRPDLSVRRAIDSAGGPLKDAVLKQVTIFRRNAENITVDLDKSEKNASEVLLQPFDIIDVPFKNRPPRKQPPIAELDSDRAIERSKFPLKIIE